MYRDILDNQVNFNKELIKGYGNTTHDEKRLNKDDLIAYKHYDNHQYALIPGLVQNDVTKSPNNFRRYNRNGL